MSEITAKKLFWLALFIVSMVLVYVLSPVLTPFIIAAFIAYLGDPIADKLELKGFVPRAAAFGGLLLRSSHFFFILHSRPASLES